MKNPFQHVVFWRAAAGLLSCMWCACANIGNPNGGPYDDAPPKYIGSKPTMNQLNFNGKKIEILFDEYISVENPAENVIVTPPQKQSPFIQAVGKRISVELKDSLKENTTYTVDFTSSIADNNEKNTLENFSFAFSTGDVLDTMQISGTLLNAADFEPAAKMLVGIHDNLNDTAFTKTPFLRTSKTDERGRFVIHNVSPGSYHIFALEDKNRNYAYDKNNNEALAFLDSIVIPSCERAIVPDTIRIDSVTIDTILMVEKTIFYPNNLVLMLFMDSIAPRQRMLRPERLQQHIFTLKFNAPVDTFPVPVPLNFEPADSLWYVTQRGENAEGFAINYWMLDSAIYKMDTLAIEVSYRKNNDSIPELIELQTDTLHIVYKDTAPKKKKDTKKTVKIKRPKDGAPQDSVPEVEKEPVIPLKVTVSPSGSLNPYDVITVTVNEPVLDVRKKYFVMEAGVDTLWQTVDFTFEEDSARAMTYHIRRDFRYNEKYRLVIDSAALHSVYGHCNDKLSTEMTVKSEKDYGHLEVALRGIPEAEGDSVTAPTPAFMELLNNSGATVRSSIVNNGVATFKDMPAEKYYARLILDDNGNGRWDAGNYAEKRQPERIIYFMQQFDIRQNWRIEETWDVSQSRMGEKPEELLKNKPREDVRKKRNYRDDSKPRGGGSSGMNMGDLRNIGRQ